MTINLLRILSVVDVCTLAGSYTGKPGKKAHLNAPVVEFSHSTVSFH